MVLNVSSAHLAYRQGEIYLNVLVSLALQNLELFALFSM